MPSSKNHAERVKQGLEFLSTADPATAGYQMVIEYFYSCLHMLEAAIYDLDKKQSLCSHHERTQYLGRFKFDSEHTFFGVSRDYEALRGLSEQARYLSPANVTNYQPLNLLSDLKTAKQLHDDVKKALEEGYEKNDKRAPWLPPVAVNSAE